MIRAQKLQRLYLKWHFRPDGFAPSLGKLSASTASRSVSMTNLRQGRWLQVFSDACSAKSSLATVALAGAMLLTGVAWGAPHSHARRPLPTALHSSRVTDSGSHAGGKKRKGGLKSRTGAETEAGSGKRGAGTRQSGKRGTKGKGRRAEPVDDPVPMYRAERGRGHSGYGLAHGQANSARNGRHGRYSNEPAPLVSSWRHGHGAAPAGSHGRSLSEYAENRPAPLVRQPVSRPAGTVERRPSPAEANRYAPMTRDAATGGYFVAQPRAYAEGVSHPEDDERSPRMGAVANGPEVRPMMTDVAPAAASASAAPSRAATAPSRPAVVQGFGGEVAVPSDGSTSADRPGGTPATESPLELDAGADCADGGTAGRAGDDYGGGGQPGGVAGAL